MDILSFLSPKFLHKIGIWQYGVIPTSQIPFEPSVRQLCEQNSCRCYGTTWACPPAVPSVDHCQAQCLSYDKVLVFSAKYPLEDSFDFEGMHAGMLSFKETCNRLDEAVRSHLTRFLLLSNESCFRCIKCTYPDAPCRFPALLHPAIEGYGIFVQELAHRAKINYINGANTVSFFGALLF